jgi:PAS domain S-box-containing protein
MRIGRRLVLGFGVIATTGVLGGLLIIYMVTTLSDLNERLFRHPLAVSNATRDVRGAILTMRRTMKDTVQARDPEQLEALIATVHGLEARIEGDLNLIAERFLGNQEDLESVREEFRSSGAVRARVFDAMHAGDPDTARRIIKEVGLLRAERLLTELQHLMDFADRKAEEFRVETRETKRRLLGLIGVLALLFTGSGLLVVRHLQSRIMRPLQRLAGTAQTLAGGDYSVRTGYQGDDEIGALGTAFDAMATRIEFAQASLEDRYQKIFETAAFLITSVNAEGIIVDCNARITPVLGYTKDEVTGQSMGTIIHPDDLHTAQDALEEILSTGSSYDKHYRMVTKDGSIRRVVINSSALLGEDGNYELTICIIEDITERVDAEARGDSLEAQLHRARRMEAVGQLAGGVAHDFNNLLTGVNGNVELARQDLHPSDPVQQSLDEITQATGRAADLIRQLLMFSRKQIAAPKVVDLNIRVIELERMLVRIIGEDVHLVSRAAAQPGTVRIDPSQLDQVLINLAVNARDAMPGGGDLVIETQNASLGAEDCQVFTDLSPGEHVQLSVSDTGYGMTAEVCGRIFEPFFTTKPEGKGSGLGLATVFGIVRQNHGDIRVYSEPGQGTTFRIYLPLVHEAATVVPKAPVTGDLPRGTETILAVEDDAAVRKVLERTLARLGYSVLSADCGPAALDLVRRDDPEIDLLVTDVIMPEMDGRELSVRLRETRPELKVLFCSGYTQDIIARRGVLEEGIHFLGKPYTPSTMARKLREILDA